MCKLKNNKAAKLNGIAAQTSKAEVEVTAGILYIKIWDQEKFPFD